MKRSGLWIVGSLVIVALPGCALFRCRQQCGPQGCGPQGCGPQPGEMIEQVYSASRDPVAAPLPPQAMPPNELAAQVAESEPQEAHILGMPCAAAQQEAGFVPWTQILEPMEGPDPPSTAAPAPTAPMANSAPVNRGVLSEVLQCMLDKHHHDALKLLQKYDQATQDFFLGILPVLARVSEKPLESMNAEEVAVMQDTLERILETLRPRSVLVINRMCLCESVKGFGVYRPMPAGHVFQAGRRGRPGDLVQVYVELRNICSECRNHFHETVLSCSVEITDPSDAKGRILWKHRFDDSKQPLRSRARLHDYYNKYSFYVPPLPPGTYQLSIQVTDETRQDAPRVARKSVEFKVGARAMNQ